jgi:galactokinase/mevalonate kinase-like predicted kinase
MNTGDPRPQSSTLHPAHIPDAQPSTLNPKPSRAVATAPGRCGILGNPTDGYGGTVISCSLAERATVAVERADQTRVTIGGESAALLDREDFQLKGDRFDCARAVLNFMHLRETPVAIDVSTNIPIQAGLAGSTAILTSMVVALGELLDLEPLEKHLLAETVRVIELHYLEIQCGYQDQYMTVFGGLNVMDFRDKEYYRELKHEIFATIESLDGFAGTDLPLVLAHTGKQRVSGRVLRPIRERWEQGDPLVREGYRRIAELARLGKRAILDRDWETVGRYMNENHRIQQQLGASGEANDRMIEAALRAGALGAKLAGAGGGGTIIALAPEPTRLADELLAAGASRVLRPVPSPGVRLHKGGCASSSTAP